jgi:hypothetical protein
MKTRKKFSALCSRASRTSMAAPTFLETLYKPRVIAVPLSVLPDVPKTFFLYKTSQSRLRKNPQKQFSSCVWNGKEKERIIPHSMLNVRSQARQAFTDSF